MADLFDNFSGSAGALHGRVAPQGGTWSDPTGQCSVNGSGAVYTSGTAAVTNIPVNSNLPGTDCAVSIVIGASYVNDTTNTAAPSVAVRISGSGATQSYYLCQLLWVSGAKTLQLYRVVAGAIVTWTGGTSLPVSTVANDVWTFTVSGSGATITLVAYKNGTLINTCTDTDPTRLTTGNGIGLVIGTVPGQTDLIRAIWAGAVPATGPPAITMVPATPTVSLGGAQSFTATTAFTGESFAWSASAGTISGTTATQTWTAPGSGTTATVTGASTDLPGRTATATATLTSAGATAFTVTGPSSGYKANASTAFTFTPTGGSYSGTIAFTMPGLAGTWAPTSRTWSASSAGQTATFTPSAVGTGTVTGTGVPPLTQSTSPTYTSNAQTLAVTPGALPTSATTLEHFYGGGTFWSTSTPTFTPSGSVAGVSCGTVTVISNTEAQANITTGTATGTFLWTDSTTGATASEVVANIANVLSIGEGFATGLSTVGYAVYDASGTLLSAWTSIGVSERGTSSGDYGAVVAIVQDGADYEIRWSQGSGTTPPFVHDVRRVAAPVSGGTGGGPTVAQIATAVWQDVAAGDFGVTGSIGNIVKTNLDVVVSTRSTYAGGPVASVTAPVVVGTNNDKIGYSLNLAQIGLAPRSLNTVADAALTVGDALMASICAAAGKESVVGTAYTVKTPSTGTTIRTFTLDASTNPSSRN